MAHRVPVVFLALVISMGVAAARPAMVDAEPPSGPIAEWTFDEADGTIAADAVGGLDGTLSGGVTRITGDVPQGSGALQFDGVDDLVTVANAATLEQTGTFTVAAWFRMPAPPVFTYQRIFGKGNLSCHSSWGFDTTYMAPIGKALLSSWPGSLTVGGDGPGYSWFDNRWHLLVYTVDPGAQQSSLSIDGHGWATDWPGPDAIRYAGADLVSPDLHVGGTGSGCPGIDPYMGSLDDLRIWSRKLGQAEILAELSSVATTTDVRICLESACPEGPSITSAMVDQPLLLRVHVSPWPAADGDVTWYRSRNGGPEEVFAITPLRIADMTGYAFAHAEAGSLTEGSYTIRAAWPGAGNWQASSSEAVPLTITRRPVSMEAAATPAAVLPGEAVTLSARVAVADPPATFAISGSVDFFETTGGTEQLLGSGDLAYAGNPTWNAASISVPSVTAGNHTYEARYPGTTSLAPAAASMHVAAGLQLSSVGLALTPNPVLNTGHATAAMWLSTFRDGDLAGGLPAPTGTLTIRAQPAGTVIATVPVTGNGLHEVPLPVYPVGTRQFSVDYSGNADFAGSSSPTETLTVTQDETDAAVGVQYATFYPYRDGYRDAVAIRGTRNEPASVAIKVVSPAGRTVKTKSFAVGTGAYSMSWDGRNSTGTMLAAGTYTVTQSLVGADGSRLRVSNKVTLSAKRLYTYTKTLTQSFPDQVDYAGSGWAAWQFTLPTAPVYRKLVFAVETKSGRPVGRFGPQDYRRCSAEYVGPACASPTATLPTTRARKSLTGSASKNRNGTKVRIVIWKSAATVIVWRARVTVTYALLR